MERLLSAASFYSLIFLFIMFTASQLLDKINNHISEIQFTRTPKGLYEPIEYILSLGGKRIRPVLMLMGYNLYREDVASIYDPATAIEVYHNHTLLHDDLMDRSDVRRGKPTVHKVWNDNTAVLSGDAMLILAFRYMTGCPPEHLKEVMDLFSLTTLEICEGQQLDMEFESRCDVTEDEYIEMIRLKTAVLLAGSLKIGAILVTEIYNQLNIRNICESKMREYYTFAMESLAAVAVAEDRKKELKNLVKLLMYREM